MDQLTNHKPISSTRNWSYDLRAAFSVALVALPLGLGIASTSGFEPIAGVTSIIIGAAVATFVRGGHVSINGPGAGLVAVLLIAVISLEALEMHWALL